MGRDVGNECSRANARSESEDTRAREAVFHGPFVWFRFVSPYQQRLVAAAYWRHAGAGRHMLWHYNFCFILYRCFFFWIWFTTKCPLDFRCLVSWTLSCTSGSHSDIYLIIKIINYLNGCLFMYLFILDIRYSASPFQRFGNTAGLSYDYNLPNVKIRALRLT